MLNRNDLLIVWVLRVTNLTSSGSGHGITEILLLVVHLLSKENLFNEPSMGWSQERKTDRIEYLQ